jgi:hypothetical protein
MDNCSADAFFGAAIGMKNSDGRRRSSIAPVGCPPAMTKWRLGSTNGELITGFAMVPLANPVAPSFEAAAWLTQGGSVNRSA